MSSTELASLVQRLEQVTVRLEKISNKQDSLAVSEDSSSAMANTNTHTCVVDFDGFIHSDVHHFVELSKKIGGDLCGLADLVQRAFAAQRQFIVMALTSAKPGNQTQMQQFLQPTADKINEVTKYRESKRSSPLFNHLSTISESIGALGWVCQEPAPGPYVKEMLAASQFYSNRVLKDYREKDATHVDWVKSWTNLLTNLQAYIKAHHTTGLSWSVLGKSGASVAPAPPSGGVPPPPPPPPPPPADDDSSKSGGSVESRAALFSQLNQGDKVTSHLKHVTKDMKGQGKKQPPPTAPKPNRGHAPATSSPPSSHTAPAAVGTKLELQGNKWLVENHRNNNEIVLNQMELKQTVYIYKCDNCTIQVKGKINSIVLDSCKKTGLVFDDLISALDIVNCQSVKVQVVGKASTVNIDKTDGCMVYLSVASKDAEIVSAKSSEMNILIPKPDGDYVEFAVPEQYRTRFDGNGLKTECTEKKG
jgi:adenylyl cyclase-associated protein